MESIVLGIVLICCIFLVYYILKTTPILTEGFLLEDNRLGKLAVSIGSPNNSENIGLNPTGLVSQGGNIIDIANTQSIYNGAFGLNVSPRIDDTKSLLYDIDFCYTAGASNEDPFANPTFASKCGICMTMGTLLTGQSSSTSGSSKNQLGVVLYKDDKVYAESQGIQAQPSLHSATCAPLVGYSESNPNVTSLATNSIQYKATKAYMASNSYSMSQGTGSHIEITCIGSNSDGNPNVIKSGSYREGNWDTHVGTIDLTRKNNLNMQPLPTSCIEQPSCSFTSSNNSVQWDGSVMCSYPIPTAITNLSNTVNTSNSLIFTWDGAKYIQTYNLDLQSGGASVLNSSGPKCSTDATKKLVTCSNLSPNTSYTLILQGNNEKGSTAYVSAEATTSLPVIAMSAITNIKFTNVTQKSITVSWYQANDASRLTIALDGVAINLTPNTRTYIFNDLNPGTIYTIVLEASDKYGRSINSSSSITTSPPPPPPPPPSDIKNITFTNVTQTSFTVNWYQPNNSKNLVINLNDAFLNINPNSRSYTFNNLSQGTKYKVRIEGTDINGLSVYATDYITTSTPPPPPPVSDITNIKFTNITENSFTVNWYQENDPKFLAIIINNNTRININSNSRSYVFNKDWNFSPSTTFTIRIESVDIYGRSVYATASVKTSNPAFCGTYGYASKDGSIRLYSQTECTSLKGNFYPNGECLHPNGGSFSWDCRNLNSEPAKPNVPYTCPQGWAQKNTDINNGTCSLAGCSKSFSFNFGPNNGGYPMNRRSGNDFCTDLRNGSDQSKSFTTSMSSVWPAV